MKETNKGRMGRNKRKKTKRIEREGTGREKRSKEQ